MPRYFFNIYNLHACNGDGVFDDTGVELENDRELRLHMVSTAMALFQSEDAHIADWEMEALDERGRIVRTMSFGLEAKQE